MQQTQPIVSNLDLTAAVTFPAACMQEAREEVLRYQQSAAFKDEQAREQERAPIREVSPLPSWSPHKHACVVYCLPVVQPFGIACLPCDDQHHLHCGRP
jgi:hypothetical protein